MIKLDALLLTLLFSGMLMKNLRSFIDSSPYFLQRFSRNPKLFVFPDHLDKNA